MSHFATVAVGLFCVASLFVGTRLLLLSRRTREVPEFVAGVALLGIGPFGFGLTVTSTLLIPHSTLAADALWAIASVALNSGTAAAYFFAYRVFHPRDARVRAVVTSLIVALVALWFIEAWLTHFVAADPASWATRSADWLRAGALLWSGIESLRYWTMLKRRIALGLAEPLIARRFLLWGVAMAGSGVFSCIDATTKLLVEHALDYPLLSLANALAGSVAALCLTLAFWPRRADDPAVAREPGGSGPAS